MIPQEIEYMAEQWRRERLQAAEQWRLFKLIAPQQKPLITMPEALKQWLGERMVQWGFQIQGQRPPACLQTLEDCKHCCEATG